MNLKQDSSRANTDDSNENNQTKNETIGPQINQSTINNTYELNNIFYIIIVLTLNLISILNIIFKLKYLIEFEIDNKNFQQKIDVYYFVFKNFYLIIINLIVIIMLSIIFLRLSLFNNKTQNLAKNSNQLGDDLIIIYENENKLNHFISPQSITPTAGVLDMGVNNQKTYFPTSLIKSSATSSSSSTASSLSPTPSLTCDTNPIDTNNNENMNLIKNDEHYDLREKFKFYKKFYFLPLNIIIHLIICLIVLFTKLVLKLQYSEIKDEEFSSNNNTVVKIISSNNTLVVSNYFTQHNSTTNTFGVQDIQNLIYNNLININIDYLNYFLALFMLLIKFTRVYLKLNFFYTFILIVNFSLYLALNLLTILVIELIFTNTKHQQPAIDATARFNAKYENKNLFVLKVIIVYIFQNKLFLLVTYLISWLLNLLYYTSFNIYLIYYYNKAQLKLISKYKYYLNRYYCLPVIPSTPSSSSSSSSATSSQTILNSTYKSSTYVLTQYKAIIFGIVILLLIELLQIPYLYNCYLNYNQNNVFLITLLMQLTYLLVNAFIWIVLTLKHRWKFNFSLKFQILLWHTLFYDYLSEYYSRNPAQSNESHVPAARLDNNSQNAQIKMLLLRKQQQLPKTFANVISSANEKLNKIDENNLLIRDECDENLNNLSMYNDNRSECSTATTVLSQQPQSQQHHLSNIFKPRILNNSSSVATTSAESTAVNINKQTSSYHYLQQNPPIVKKIVQINRSKKLTQIEPKQQLVQQNRNDLANISAPWNEFTVNERN